MELFSGLLTDENQEVLKFCWILDSLSGEITQQLRAVIKGCNP